jgi:hypothetical protein
MVDLVLLKYDNQYLSREVLLVSTKFSMILFHASSFKRFIGVHSSTKFSTKFKSGILPARPF